VHLAAKRDPKGSQHIHGYKHDGVGGSSWKKQKTKSFYLESIFFLFIIYWNLNLEEFFFYYYYAVNVVLSIWGYLENICCEFFLI
jgi:hypothetical protein